MVRLKTSEPVILIGIARPDRIEDVLATLDLSFKTHVRECYPATFANNVDRNTKSKSVLTQDDVPPIGTSLGAVVNDRHTVSLGAYVRLSSNPKKLCVLTVPPTHQISKNTVISQPSIADRDEQNFLHDQKGKAVLDADPNQATALRERRTGLERTFEFSRVVGFSNYPSPLNDGDNTLRNNATYAGTIPHPSECWLVAEVTRLTTSRAIVTREPKSLPLPFKTSKPTLIRPLRPSTVVSKQGRTTGRTIGTVNGIKSLYRLPRDGQGVRRFDYIVLSHPWGGTFGYPGDAGAILMSHEQEDIEDNTRITQVGRPCGMVIAASTSGHITFVESLEDVTAGIMRQGLGTVSFLDGPKQ